MSGYTCVNKGSCGNTSRSWRDLGNDIPASHAPPNKRFKLAGPAFRGGARLCASEPAPQGGALAPAGVRPAA